MKKFPLLFIDDSGDPGLKSTSSRFLVMAAVIFASPEEATECAKMINKIKGQWGWDLGYEFKFRKMKKDLIIEMLKSLDSYTFSVGAVFIDKDKFKERMPGFRVGKLYNWTLAELLKINALTGAHIHIDGRANKQQLIRTRTYLRKELGRVDIRASRICFDDSARTELIQMADLVAGAIGRSLDKEKGDCE